MHQVSAVMGGLALVLCACTPSSAPADAGGRLQDAGRSWDASAPGGDASIADATSDAMPLDGGPRLDAASPDASAADAAATDATLMDTGTQDAGQLAVALPPPNVAFDYQLGGAYAPPSGVLMVVRDRKEAPAAGLYNVCYVNGFQIQPGEEQLWMSQYPDLMLRDARGDLVIDDDWGEYLIDVSTATKRRRVAQLVGAWIQGCKAAGYDAVEIDNLDSYLRARGTLSQDDNVAAMGLFAQVAHQQGLAIAQKNSAEVVSRRAELFTDFAIVEECNRYDECDAFTREYSDQVFIIEYRARDFAEGCRDYPQLSIIHRDLDLVPVGASGHRYDGC